MAIHKQATVETMNALVQNPPVLFVAGLLGTIEGLAIVLTHKVWSGGALPVVVTLTGWQALSGRTAKWPDLAEAYDLRGLTHDTDKHMLVLVSVLCGCVERGEVL
jgi:hypothetical protein